MKSHRRSSEPQEIELKLCLPGADPAGLVKRLANMPLLARRKSSQQSLYNTYFDTPDQLLRQQGAVLRLRRVGSEADPQWLQTLKTGASDASALSRRGEWETVVAGQALDLAALRGTQWSELDRDGSLFECLVPTFVTRFERTLWLVRRRDRSVVEVALDIGHIEAEGKQAPICELELELKAGLPSALFEIAGELARTLAVLPANLSKAQRGYLLAQDALHLPQRAQTPRLDVRLNKKELAQVLMREMFAQFTQNLDTLRMSDDPEVVHQARIGWRRFKSGLRLFRKTLAASEIPSWIALKPLLTALGEMRNLDVAVTETLPSLSSSYASGDAQRSQDWQTLTAALTHSASLQRLAVRRTLQEPDVGMCLLALTEWLENLSAVQKTGSGRKGELRDWAKGQIVRLQKRLAMVQKSARTPQDQHRVRILAKRLRYGVEALRDLLPKRLANTCLEQALRLQSGLGLTRDVSQAGVLVARNALDPAIAAFLRGVAVGANLSARE